MDDPLHPLSSVDQMLPATSPVPPTSLAAPRHVRKSRVHFHTRHDGAHELLATGAGRDSPQQERLCSVTLVLGSLSSASPSVYSFPVIGGSLRSQGWLPAGTTQGGTRAAAGAPARPRSLSQL